MSSDKDKTRTDARPTDLPGTSAAGTGKLPSDVRRDTLTHSSSDADVADFVRRLKELGTTTATGRGRLIFAMDATMSRQPTWDMALALQADMFQSVKAVGGLDVQLIYFRGSGECRASRWVSDPDALAALMARVACAGGYTQIGKVLSHARAESIDDLCGRAGELTLLGVPVFLFQEGDDGRAEQAFREIARLTKGAYCRFDAGSAAQLRELLAAVAVYAAGGRKALQALKGRGARHLLQQLK
jgi:hypothetical protein